MNTIKAESNLLQVFPNPANSEFNLRVSEYFINSTYVIIDELEEYY
ncbi:MAG: hypothetical protein IPG08_17700 [Sphingobacteriaceae bacterium]|nr:hypothetical protein [Sphingobacteriaceae bacterium]